MAAMTNVKHSSSLRPVPGNGNKTLLSPGFTTQELARCEGEAALPEEAPSQDVLDWSFAHKSTFPTLCRAACIYLAILATWSTAERIFSTTGNMVTFERNRLDPETANGLVFLYCCEGVGWEIIRQVNGSNEKM